MYKTRLGHAHLKVRDLERAVAFYTRMFGLRVVERVGDQYAFLSGSDVHHEIALQNVGSQAPQPPIHGTGLYHVAFEVPDRRAFAQSYLQLIGAGVEVALVDHYISWAMYFTDPDGNGLEIYCDTRHEPGGQALWRGRNALLQVDTIMAASGCAEQTAERQIA